MYTFTAYLNSDARFFSEILDLYLDFIKFTVERVDSYTHLLPDMFKNFPVIELSVFKFNFIYFFNYS